MVRPSKKKQIPNLQEAIKDAAWKQIAGFGAAALSLRAIARELKITAPAIYNYFPDRDALVTALIMDAYMSFGNHQLEARDAVPQDDHAGRLKAIGLAYREWAHAHPQHFQLLFGAPLPGYAADIDEIFPASAHAISGLFSVVEGIRAAGKLNSESFSSVESGYKTAMKQWKAKLAEVVHPLTYYAAMIIWARVHGLVTLELNGNLPPFGENGDALCLFEIDSMARQFIKGQK
jgi:AcrR family transcriptional regulator